MPTNHRRVATKRRQPTPVIEEPESSVGGDSESQEKHSITPQQDESPPPEPSMTVEQEIQQQQQQQQQEAQESAPLPKANPVEKEVISPPCPRAESQDNPRGASPYDNSSRDATPTSLDIGTHPSDEVEGKEGLPHRDYAVRNSATTVVRHPQATAPSGKRIFIYRSKDNIVYDLYSV